MQRSKGPQSVSSIQKIPVCVRTDDAWPLLLPPVPAVSPPIAAIPPISPVEDVLREEVEEEREDADDVDRGEDADDTDWTEESALLTDEEDTPHAALQALKFWKGSAQVPKGLQLPASQHTPCDRTEEDEELDEALGCDEEESERDMLLLDCETDENERELDDADVVLEREETDDLLDPDVLELERDED
jgi:hypothetical protein